MIGRTIRLLKAMFSKGLNALSDPKVMLEYELEEMKQKLINLNDGVARARGAVIVLRSEVEKQKETEAVLSDFLKTAIKTKAPTATQLSIAKQIGSCRESRARAIYSLKSSEKTVETMLDIRDAFSIKVKDRILEIRETLEAKQYSDLKREVASLFQSFADADSLIGSDDSLNKLKREIADDEGRMEDVQSSPDFGLLKIQRAEIDAKGIKILEEFKKSK